MSDDELLESLFGEGNCYEFPLAIARYKKLKNWRQKLLLGILFHKGNKAGGNWFPCDAGTLVVEMNHSKPRTIERDLHHFESLGLISTMTMNGEALIRANLGHIWDEIEEKS